MCCCSFISGFLAIILAYWFRIKWKEFCFLRCATIVVGEPSGSEENCVTRVREEIIERQLVPSSSGDFVLVETQLMGLPHLELRDSSELEIHKQVLSNKICKLLCIAEITQFGEEFKSMLLLDFKGATLEENASIEEKNKLKGLLQLLEQGKWEEYNNVQYKDKNKFHLKQTAEMFIDGISYLQYLSHSKSECVVSLFLKDPYWLNVLNIRGRNFKTAPMGSQPRHRVHFFTEEYLTATTVILNTWGILILLFNIFKFILHKFKCRIVYARSECVSVLEKETLYLNCDNPELYLYASVVEGKLHLSTESKDGIVLCGLSNSEPGSYPLQIVENAAIGRIFKYDTSMAYRGDLRPPRIDDEVSFFNFSAPYGKMIRDWPCFWDNGHYYALNYDNCKYATFEFSYKTFVDVSIALYAKVKYGVTVRLPGRREIYFTGNCDTRDKKKIVWLYNTVAARFGVKSIYNFKVSRSVSFPFVLQDFDSKFKPSTNHTVLFPICKDLKLLPDEAEFHRKTEIIVTEEIEANRCNEMAEEDFDVSDKVLDFKNDVMRLRVLERQYKREKEKRVSKVRLINNIKREIRYCKVRIAHSSETYKNFYRDQIPEKSIEMKIRDERDYQWFQVRQNKESKLNCGLALFNKYSSKSFKLITKNWFEVLNSQEEECEYLEFCKDARKPDYLRRQSKAWQGGIVKNKQRNTSMTQNLLDRWYNYILKGGDKPPGVKKYFGGGAGTHILNFRKKRRRFHREKSKMVEIFLGNTDVPNLFTNTV